MKTIFLSSDSYDDVGKNYGDCIIIDTGTDLVVYDCGSKEHAIKVCEYMEENGYETAIGILSHNDSDHFNGFEYLIEMNKVNEIVTVLLLKYKDRLLDLLNDNRRNRNSIGEQITERYNNISSLSGKVKLNNIYNDDGFVDIVNGISVVGPDLDYLLEVTAKALDSKESDLTQGETIVNATSVQLKIQFTNGYLLLCGDANYEAVEANLSDNIAVQLPHHGKPEIAEKIFNELYGQNNVLYIVSDNTGNSNGGSDKLNSKGRFLKNTKVDGDIIVTNEILKSQNRQVGTYLRRL